MGLGRSNHETVIANQDLTFEDRSMALFVGTLRAGILENVPDVFAMNKVALINGTIG